MWELWEHDHISSTNRINRWFIGLFPWVFPWVFPLNFLRPRNRSASTEDRPAWRRENLHGVRPLSIPGIDISPLGRQWGPIGIPKFKQMTRVRIIWINTWFSDLSMVESCETIIRSSNWTSEPFKMGVKHVETTRWNTWNNHPFPPSAVRRSPSPNITKIPRHSTDRALSCLLCWMTEPSCDIASFSWSNIWPAGTKKRGISEPWSLRWEVIIRFWSSIFWWITELLPRKRDYQRLVIYSSMISGPFLDGSYEHSC